MKQNKVSQISQENYITMAKCISSLVILVIILYYALSFAFSSANYNVNKVYGDIIESNKIFSGLYIAEVYIGGLTKEQALKVAESEYADRRLDGYTMNIKTDYGYNKTFTFRELGAEYDIEKAVNAAYDVNRSGSKSERIGKLDDLEGRTEHIAVKYNVNEDKLKEAITNIIADVNKEYSLLGKEADFDSTYNTVLKYMQIQEKDVEVYVAENMSSEE